VQLFFDNLPSVQCLSAVLFLVESLQSFEVVCIIDFTVISRNGEIFTCEGCPHFGEEHFFELFIDSLVDIDVIDAHAGLAAVEELPEDDAFGSALEVCALIDDDWALASQFQDAGRQILGGLYRHQPARFGGACEADDIELEPGEGLGHLHLPFNHAVEPCIRQQLRGSMYF
jgi:hypothetical protein